MPQLTPAQHEHFLEHGYVVVPGLFTEPEVAFYREHYTNMRLEAAYPGDDAGVDSQSHDPLKKYPRMIHMHHWDDHSMNYLLEPRIREILAAFVGSDPYAVQTMLYFKPAGARGQALHQDNYYLRVQPGTCLAAWTALDDCDEENGCMQMVPGSHAWPILCPVQADTSASFTDTTVPLPPGTPVEPIRMSAGDTLFFNGSIVHGSFPNTSRDRFRRSLIAHYVQGDAEQIGQWYNPVLRMDGTVYRLEDSPGATKCGEWTEAAGEPQIALSGQYVMGSNVHD
jgi:phytanoyl-CoA hydroxylase